MFTFEHRYIKKVLLFISFIKFVKLCKNSIFGTCKSYLFGVTMRCWEAIEIFWWIHILYSIFIKEKSSSYLKFKYHFYTVTTTDGKNVVIYKLAWGFDASDVKIFISYYEKKIHLNWDDYLFNYFKTIIRMFKHFYFRIIGWNCD